MGRYTGPKCRLCRRESTKLFLKGSRCVSNKCAIERREGVPGMKPFRRGKPSEHAIRLREKQKVKRYYGVYEKQFRKYYDLASRRTGNTGDLLLSYLERRLDNVIARLGFAPSRAAARQLIGHGHLKINGRKCDISSYLVRPGDTIVLKEREASTRVPKETLELEWLPPVPDWLERTEGNVPEGKVLRMPTAQDISLPVQAQLIVELLSR